MLLSQHLCRKCVVSDLAAPDKAGALAALASLAESAGLDKTAVHTVLLDREKLGSTAVGNGYAIPHGVMPGLSGMILLFARSVSGVDFDAPDKRKIHFFFVVLAPEGAVGQHLGLLGAIARLAKDASFTTRLAQAKNAAELADFLATV